MAEPWESDPIEEEELPPPPPVEEVQQPWSQDPVVEQQPVRESPSAVAVEAARAAPDLGPIARNAGEALGETASGLIPKTAGEFGEFAVGTFAPAVQAVRDIGTTWQSVYDVLFGGKSIEETNVANRPEAATFAEVDQTPAFSKERFRAGFDILAQMGMAAAVGRGLQPKGPHEVLFPEEKPEVPTELTKATAKIPIEEIKPTEEVIPNASEITSPEGATQPEVRTPVGEEPPLRQQGETPEARQGVEAQPAQEVVEKSLVPESEAVQDVGMEVKVVDTGAKPVSGVEPPPLNKDNPHYEQNALGRAQKLAQGFVWDGEKWVHPDYPGATPFSDDVPKPKAADVKRELSRIKGQSETPFVKPEQPNSVGDTVKFTTKSVAYKNGEPVTVENREVGRITQIKNGKIEVKSQKGGYHVFEPGEFETVKDTGTKPVSPIAEQRQLLEQQKRNARLAYAKARLADSEAGNVKLSDSQIAAFRKEAFLDIPALHDKPVEYTEQGKFIDVSEGPSHGGPSFAVKLDDGTILHANDAALHSQLIERSGVDPSRVVDAGRGGPLTGFQGGASDLVERAELARAEKRSEPPAQPVVEPKVPASEVTGTRSEGAAKHTMVEKIDKRDTRDWSKLPAGFEHDATKAAFNDIKGSFSKQGSPKYRIAASRATSFKDLRAAVDDYLGRAKTGSGPVSPKDYGIPDGMIEEGLNTNYPDVAEAIEKYSHGQDPIGITEALKSDDYPAYRDDLHRLLIRSYGNKPVPVIRVEGYEPGSHGKGVGEYMSVSTNPWWGENAAKRGGKRIQGAVDPRDVVLAGNEAEGELIIRKGGFMKLSEVPMEPHEQFVKGGMTAKELPKTAKAQTVTDTGTQPVSPKAEVTGPPPATPEAPPVEVPITPQKPSKIGKSIETKAVEAKLTQGFSETAGYDPITIADQAQRATSLIKSSPADARAIVRGETPLPEGLRGTSLITAMEERLLKKPDAQLAYELANSPLTSATSAAAQEMRLMSERVPDSLAAKFQEIREARQEGSKKRGETTERLFKDIQKEVVRQSSKRPTWEAFVKEITCPV